MSERSAFTGMADSLSVAIFLMGCGSVKNETAPISSDHQHDELKSNLAKLSATDRLLAEAQGSCVATGEPLGSMGPPIKLMVKNQPVFICCGGCATKAEANPDQTLAKVAELKAKVKSGTIR